MKYASIIPLIGGETLGAQLAMEGQRPEYLLSYSPFASNDSHIVHHYKGEVPYIVLDKGGVIPSAKVDIVNAVCPCAGLSSLSPSANADAAVNDWLFTSAELVLSSVKPQVFWGENAPRFAGDMGKPIVEKLAKLAALHGYSMSIYKTKSMLHGLSQVRERSFYFFWKGDRIPIFNYYGIPHRKIEDTILGVSPTASQNDVTNPKIPSKDDPFYRYVLEELEGGCAHAEFVRRIDLSTDVMWRIEKYGVPYQTVGKWMKREGYDKLAVRCETMAAKLETGGNIMRRSTLIPKDYIGAFVGHIPVALAHPVEDRYITVREAMSIMALPEDFELLYPKKNLNHICQNVPVTTARDMMLEIMASLNGERRWIPRDSDLMVGYQFNVGQYTKYVDFSPPQRLNDLTSFF